jgi:hypothetical protein
MSTVLRLFAATSLSVVIASGADAATPSDGSHPPTSSHSDAALLSAVEVLKTGAVDREMAHAEDEVRAVFGPGPLRFALAEDVTIDSTERGTWDRLPDGSRLWRLRVHSPNATNLNFGFSRYRLPPGATLHIIGETDGKYQGPYTSDDNKDHGRLWTAMVAGERAVIELFVPAGAAFEPELELGRIGRGYRDLFGTFDSTDKRGLCNIDVVCPEGDPWRDQIRSVGRYTISGMYLCTGSLVIDVPNSFTPYFLSAAHCDVSAINDDSVVVYWNYETDTCATPTFPANPNLYDNQSGSTFRASWAASDLLLIELDSQPTATVDAFYAGWDARDQTPSATTAIHHPAGDEKSISFDYDPATITSYLGDTGPGDGTHFRVADWDLGTTEGGSSGSCLFDNATGRCVGTLHGGWAACGNDDPDWYGRFSRHWTGGGTDGTRLSNWLDPGATGTQFMDGVNGGGGGGGGGGGSGGNVPTCGNAFYDDDASASALFFVGGGHAGDPSYMFAVKFELADFGLAPGSTRISSFCAGNQIDYTAIGGPWSNEVFIYPDSGGMPDDSTILGQGTIVTGDGGGWYQVVLPTPVTLDGDFWLVNRGYFEHAGIDFNMEYDSSSAVGQSYSSGGAGIGGLAVSDRNYMLRATLQTGVIDRQIFSDGFESGDTSAWSSSVP